MPSVPLLPYPHGQSLHFRRYVLLPPLSFGQIAHGEAESFPPCQRRLQRVALADTHGAADLLGDDHAAEVVDPAHDSGCLHIRKTPLLCFAFRQPYFLQNPVVYAVRAAHGRSSFFFKKCLPRRKTSPEQSTSAPGTFSDRSGRLRRSRDRRGRGACTFSAGSGWRASRAGRRRWHRSRCP